MSVSDSDLARVYNNTADYPTLADVADKLGISRKTVRNRAGIMRRTADAPTLVSRASMPAPTQEREEFYHAPMREPIVHNKPHTGTKRFILTSAQDATKIHEGFWRNLKAYAAACEAEILVAGFTYSKNGHENADRKFGKKGAANEYQGPVFHPELRDYLTTDRIELGDGVVFCGEMNTSPTAVSPLSGFETYTQTKWGIFPHVKVQLKSIATAKKAIAKQIMTTGAVTLPNYILKKEGIKANFHHIIGAVIVEVAADGAFFCRHLIAEDDDGSFYDLTRYVKDGVVTHGHRVAAMTYGDIHHEKLDPVVALTTWGYDVNTGELDAASVAKSLRMTLAPEEEFIHDLSDFTPRNHHNINDPHFLFKMHAQGTSNVRVALEGCAKFLNVTRSAIIKTFVVQSNHDNALTTWLKSNVYDWKKDPENAIFYLETQLAYFKWLATGDGEPPIFENILGDMADISHVTFLNEDESHLILGQIEGAMHGHLGANGAKASPAAFTKMGYRSNTAHTHSPAITDGNYCCGVSGKLEQGYNKGLSSWAQAHTVTYMNAKRTILTMMNGRWYEEWTFA